jgi:2-keto-3-deoxy-L-rhamnonate aldolase RhmA
MRIRFICSLVLAAAAYGQQAPRIFNTVKTKLKEGKQVVGGTVSSYDPDVYCAMANAGFDFTWIEMQHSTLSYTQVANMIRYCKGASAMPFIRVPDATEGDIQKAMDLGAAGIIVPMVDTVEKIQNAVKFANYPPVGVRSQGGGQYGALWGADYRQIANANLVVVAMIENPKGVAIADQIAAVPGVDCVFIASTDLGSFSGFKQGEPQYEALVDKIKAAVLAKGVKLGAPHAWQSTRKDYTLFQAAGEGQLIRMGAQAALKSATMGAETPRGVAPIEGAEKH